jgi:hypothetical protein
MSATGSITVRMPLAVRPRPGRKTIVRPAGSASSASIAAHADPVMVKALARAFRWKRLLDDGSYASISGIATAEKIDRGYVGNIMRLTLLAPEKIVEAILNRRQRVGLALSNLPSHSRWNGSDSEPNGLATIKHNIPFFGRNGIWTRLREAGLLDATLAADLTANEVGMAIRRSAV